MRQRFKSDNTATYAVTAYRLGALTWDAKRRAITDTHTGHVWALRNHSKGGVIIRPIRSTGATPIR